MTIPAASTAIRIVQIDCSESSDLITTYTVKFTTADPDVGERLLALAQRGLIGIDDLFVSIPAIPKSTPKRREDTEMKTRWSAIDLGDDAEEKR